MTDLTVVDVRSFVPASDFQLSLAFYQALGCAVSWSDDTLAVLELGPSRFYLQNYYVKEWAENCMLHISVSDAWSWKEHIDSLVSGREFPGVRVNEPKSEAYGALVTYAWDPAGVLLHFAEWDASE